MLVFVYPDAPFFVAYRTHPEALLEGLDALDLEAARALVRTQREQLHTQQRKLSSQLVRQVEQMEFQLEELEAARSEDRIAEPLPKTEAVSHWMWLELAGLGGDVAFVSAEYRLSERTACKLLDLERSSYRYKPLPDRNRELREELLKLARQ